jgi:hypothetical protein
MEILSSLLRQTNYSRWCLLILFVVLLPSPNLRAQLPSYVPRDGLRGWWPFDGHSRDESGNSAHCLAQDCLLTTDRNGRQRAAYQLNGSSSNMLTDVGPLTTNQLSISVWINVAGQQPGEIGIIVSRENGHPNGLFIFDSRQYIQSITPCQNQFQYNVASVSAPLGAWQHVVCTYDGSTMRVYVNGRLLRMQQSNATYCIAGQFQFGSDIPYGRFFKGSIDDIGIWDRALSEDEIEQLLKSGCEFNASTLRGPASACEQSVTVHKVIPNPDRNYLWECSSNGEITQSATSDSAVIFWKGSNLGADTVYLRETHLLTRCVVETAQLIRIKPLPIASIRQLPDGILDAEVPYEASYQWLQNPSTLIQGAVKPRFRPMESGIYSVIVVRDGCSDTSLAFNYNAVSVSDEDQVGQCTYKSKGARFLRTLSRAKLGVVELEIAIDGPGRLEVLSIDSRRVASLLLDSNTRIVPIDLSEVSSGLYVAVLKTADDIDVQTFFAFH